MGLLGWGERADFFESLAINTAIITQDTGNAVLGAGVRRFGA